MEHFLESIFNGKQNEDAHSEFIKYGKGRYENKYLVSIKKQKDKYAVKTSSEFVNFIVKFCLQNSGKINVKGIIITTSDITKDVEFDIENIKKYLGIQQIVINTEIESEKIIALMNKYPRAFYALSFPTSNCELKVKAKAPKSGKPSTNGEKEAMPDFCSLKTRDKNILDLLSFDCKEFNEISIKNTININDIILPKGLDDPVQIREQSKRKGFIERKIVADGKETVKKADFTA